MRKTEATNVTQKLWAKAIAISRDREGPAILVTVDNTGVPKHVRDEVVARLQKKKGINPDRFALCSSPTHSAPYLAGYLPTLFGEPLSPEPQAHVERYTCELVDAIEKVALEALKNRKLGKLSWTQRKATFAANRRTKGGPVDHDLPMLAVTDAKGKLRALLVNYACHCTTLGGEFNQVCGDCAGYTQEFLERDHPGVTVLVAIGCGADANDVPCYIPSERIIKEGGYEGGGAMTYYGWPTRIAPGVEQLIVNAVHELLPKDFLFDNRKPEFPTR